MRHSITKELYAYWNVLRGTRSAPERLDIDPSVIRSLLADTFILDHDAAAGFPFRLSGTRNNQLFDRELRNQPFMDLWQPDDRIMIERLLNAVSDDMCPTAASVQSAEGPYQLNLEILLLPLRHHGQTHARLLGCLTPMTTPDWLGLMPIGPLKLQTVRVIDPAKLNAPVSRFNFRVGEHLPIFERRTSHFAGQVTPPRTLRHLTIYEGGR